MGGPTKGKADFYQEGDWNAVCSICGREFKASQLRKHWQGMYRCSDCWEPRHPQDFVKGVKDIQSPPWTQPPIDAFTVFCSFNGQSAIPGYAIPGCMIPGRATFDPNSP